MIKNFFLQTLVIFSAVLADYTILPRMRILGSHIDLSIICLVYFSMIFRSSPTLFPGIFTGVSKDALSSLSFGLQTFIFTLTGILINQSLKWIISDKFWVRMAYVSVVSLLVLGSLDALENMLSLGWEFSRRISWQPVIARSLLNGLVSPFCFFMLSKLTK